MDALTQDIRYAVRSLAKSPVLSVAAVLALGLGIGATVSMYGVVDRLFFRPPAHVMDPSRVVRLYVRHQGLFINSAGSGEGMFTGPVAAYPRYADLRDHARSFSAVAAFVYTGLAVGRGDRADHVTGGLVTASFFDLLGVRPELGRFFTRDEDREQSPTHVIVLADHYWHSHFGGDSSILGRTVPLGRNVYTVIGVAPPGFAGVELDAPDLWVPLTAMADEVFFPGVLRCSGCGMLGTIGRLARGVSAQQAAAEGTALYRAYQDPLGGRDSSAVVSVGSVHDALGPTADKTGRLSLWFTIVCGIVLLIACADVANLLLARAVRRRREMAVRLALGAGRARLVRQLLAESGVLAALGGGVALLVILWWGPALRVTVLPDLTGSVLDSRAVLFSGAAVLLTTILAGLAPALQASAPHLSDALKAGPRAGDAYGRRSVTRAALLLGQVALTVVLLAGAGLFMTSLRNLRRRPIGFDASHLIAASVDLSTLGYARADINAAYAAMRRRLLRDPAITDVSLSIGSPFGSGFGVPLAVPGRDSLPKTGIRFIEAVSTDYLHTMGSRILRGRGFTDGDVAGAPRVVVINEAMARDLWPGDEPLGRCLKIGHPPAPCFEVVGVVENSIRSVGSLTGPPTMQYYIPLAQNDSVLRQAVTGLLVRTRGPAEAAVRPVRHAIQASIPSLPYVTVDPYPGEVTRLVAPWRRGSALLGQLGGLGLLLAGIGLYGVLSYLVSERVRELGLRIALGARRSQLLGLILRQGVGVALGGVMIGIGAALAAGRLVAALLYGVAPNDPAVLGLVAVVLTLVAALASYLPARRATKIDPMVALRYE